MQNGRFMLNFTLRRELTRARPAIEGNSGFRGEWSLIRQLLNYCQGDRYLLVTTILACCNGTRWSANSQAAVLLVDDVVVIAVHREPQSLYSLASVASTNVTQVYALISLSTTYKQRLLEIKVTSRKC